MLSRARAPSIDIAAEAGACSMPAPAVPRLGHGALLCISCATSWEAKLSATDIQPAFAPWAMPKLDGCFRDVSAGAVFNKGSGLIRGQAYCPGIEDVGACVGPYVGHTSQSAIRVKPKRFWCCLVDFKMGDLPRKSSNRQVTSQVLKRNPLA